MNRKKLHSLLALTAALLLLPLWAYGSGQDGEDEPAERPQVEADEIAREVDEALAEIPWDEIHREVREALDAVDWDQIHRDVHEAVGQVEWDEIGKTVRDALKAVDWDQIHRDVHDEMDAVDWDEIHRDRRPATGLHLKKAGTPVALPPPSAEREAERGVDAPNDQPGKSGTVPRLSWSPQVRPVRE
jgi:hypothetical protein